MRVHTGEIEWMWQEFWIALIQFACILGEKPHVCKVCTKAFRKLKLKICYTFRSLIRFFAYLDDSSSLSKHMNLHLPEKPFQCKRDGCFPEQWSEWNSNFRWNLSGQICLKKFNQKYCLKKHLETHENDHLLKGEWTIARDKILAPFFINFLQL